MFWTILLISHSKPTSPVRAQDGPHGHDAAAVQFMAHTSMT